MISVYYYVITFIRCPTSNYRLLSFKTTTAGFSSIILIFCKRRFEGISYIISDNDFIYRSPTVSVTIDRPSCLYKLDIIAAIQTCNNRCIGIGLHEFDTTLCQLLTPPMQSDMVIQREAFAVVRCKAGMHNIRQIWRVEINKRTTWQLFQYVRKIVRHKMHLRLIQIIPDRIQSFGIDNIRGRIIAKGYVKLPLLVHTIQPVKAGLIQVDEPCCSLHLRQRCKCLYIPVNISDFVEERLCI